MADLLPNTIRILRGALWPSLPWAALFFAAGAAYLLAKKRRVQPLQLAALCLYAAMLLYGTVLSRVHSAADFFSPHLAAAPPYFVWHFVPASPLSQLHFASNNLLFVPFGLFARLAARKNGALHTCVLAGFAASCVIELFQLLHGLQFDFGDLTANTLGTLLGALLAALLLHAAKSRKQ